MVLSTGTRASLHSSSALASNPLPADPSAGINIANRGTLDVPLLFLNQPCRPQGNKNTRIEEPLSTTVARRNVLYCRRSIPPEPVKSLKHHFSKPRFLL